MKCARMSADKARDMCADVYVCVCEQEVNESGNKGREESK